MEDEKGEVELMREVPAGTLMAIILSCRMRLSVFFSYLI